MMVGAPYLVEELRGRAIINIVGLRPVPVKGMADWAIRIKKVRAR